MEKKLLRLLQEYYHYKRMTYSNFKFSENVGMSFYDFIQWLESREMRNLIDLTN